MLTFYVHYSKHTYTIEAIMSTIADKAAARVAAAVKDRRERLGMTMRALASRSGISSSMISEIERGAKSPTISTLSALAQALGVPLSALVEEAVPAAGRIQVVRATEQPELVDPVSSAHRKSYKPPLRGSKVEFIRYVVPSKKIAGPFAAHPQGTIEHMHVAAGTIRVVFGNEAVNLKAGDSCSCFADIAHHFDNRQSRREALIYIVVEQP
jgi:transcriptional regulator with XRE-family HTH domain